MRISDWSSDVCSSDLGRSTGGSTSETAVAGTGGRTSVGDGDAATGGNEGQVTNVADGVAATDAVNKGQLDTGIADAKAYTDTTATQTLSSANAYTDAKFAAWDDTFAAFQGRSEEHTSELQSLMTISYAVFCLNKK